MTGTITIETANGERTIPGDIFTGTSLSSMPQQRHAPFRPQSLQQEQQHSGYSQQQEQQQQQMMLQL
jgi:hypothetical protein